MPGLNSSRLTRLAVCGALGAGLAVAPTAAAFGASVCDSYSHTCVKGHHYTKHPIQTLPSQASQLPFTGAEIAGMSLAGLAAIGGGAALVVAGRRRRLATIHA